METRCYGCMNENQQHPICEHCGFDERTQNEPHQLPVGTVLREQYVVGKVLGQGGFGITYLGWDRNLEEPVAIKEYFPSGQVSRYSGRSTVLECTAAASQFEEGRERFLKEARTLAKLRKVGNIVQVMGFFAENNTAYIVMEYVEGITLQEYMRQRGGKLTISETFTILQPVLKALHRVHQADMIHRDISPDNIMLQNDGTVKLLDFGTARDVDNHGGQLTHSTQAVLKHGFAPIEQYTSGRSLDRRVDEYALCATVWCCLTGTVPTDAPTMVMDRSRIDWSAIPGLTDPQRAALEKGTALRADDRFPDLEALYIALFGAAPEYTLREAEITSTEPSMPASNPSKIPGTLPMPEPPASSAAAIPGTLPLSNLPPVPVNPPMPSPEAAGASFPEQMVPPAAAKEKKWKKPALLAAALLTAVLLIVYLSSYNSAKDYALSGNFAAADRALSMPSITKLHDEKLIDYIQAGKLMESGKYEAANAAFKKLSGYMNANALEMEAAYQHGVHLLREDADYSGASEIFNRLVMENYSGAAEMYKETQCQWALALIKQKDYVGAYNKLGTVSNYSDVRQTLSELTDLMYLEGQSLYSNASYEKAKSLFTCISGYRESNSYLTLIDARSTSANNDLEGTVQKLKKLIGFEDAAALLVEDDDIAGYFLRGKWKTKNGKYYFNMDDEFSSTYNLPWKATGDYYYFENGVYSVGDSYDKKKAEFYFTVLSEDSIKVYCYKNKGTYTLYR